MHILVTGGCGYVGSVLIPKLLNDGHNIISVDTKWFGDYLPKHKRLKNIKSLDYEFSIDGKQIQEYKKYLKNNKYTKKDKSFYK